MDKNPRGWDGLTVMLIGMILVFGAFVGTIMIGGIANAPRDDAMGKRRAIESQEDDVSWLVLKDAARRHLSAVRSDAATLPDAELGSALLDYYQNGR